MTLHIAHIYIHTHTYSFFTFCYKASDLSPPPTPLPNNIKSKSSYPSRKKINNLLSNGVDSVEYITELLTTGGRNSNHPSWASEWVCQLWKKISSSHNNRRGWVSNTIILSRGQHHAPIHSTPRKLIIDLIISASGHKLKVITFVFGSVTCRLLIYFWYAVY